MVSMSKKGNNIEVGYHAVVFIDLMGQQEHLRKLTSLPSKNNPEQYQELVNTLKSTYGAVNSMRQSFNKFFEGFGKKSINPKRIPKDKRKLLKELDSNPIRFHQFSDFVAGFLSLRTDKGKKLPMQGIYGLIGATAAASLTSLASGHPIRGGLDIGIGIELKQDEIYGASLARAYALESHIANYPRVVIGEELNKYLIQSSNQPQIDEITKASAQLANHCIKMLAIDDDGYAFIDFMGKVARDNAKDAGIGPELVQKAYDFVVQSSGEFQNKRESKIAFKYTLLRNYMESRLHLWGINHSEV